ncbi:UreD urease accessory protein-domain-containing protein [Phycomyces nitens]|nr:UreD urease accessory protein-domain-containing protein [Phycomyces nitens]
MKRFSSENTDIPGKGILVCQCHDRETRFSRIHAQYPLKFIPTKAYADRLAVVYMLSYGGGVVSGDLFDVVIEIESQAILMMLTQGNTKIFKDRVHQQKWMASLAQTTQPSLGFSTLIPSKVIKEDPIDPSDVKISQQHITAAVAHLGTLIILPDPVTSFRDSSFQSKQTFRLEDASSQLVLLDWFTSGRQTRENWSFRHYMSHIDVWVGKRMVLRDRLVLEDEEYMRTDGTGETSYAARLRPYTCFATLIIISADPALISEPSSLKRSIELLQEKAEQVRMLPNSMHSPEDRGILWSTSSLLGGRGVLVRISGMTTEKVRDFVKNECLGEGLKGIIGEGMFKKVLS